MSDSRAHRHAVLVQQMQPPAEVQFVVYGTENVAYGGEQVGY